MTGMVNHAIGYPSALHSPKAALRQQGQLADFRNFAPRDSIAQQDTEKPNASGSSLVGLMLKVSFVLLALAVLAYGVVVMLGGDFSRGGHSASTEKVEIVIANSVLEVPSNLIRLRSQRTGGSLTKLELYLHWPSMSGYADALKSDFSKGGNHGNLLFLTLEPRSMSHDMSGRISPIYSKFFKGTGKPAAAGLIQQPLSSDGGFIDEDLFYEAQSPYPYATRCVRETSTTATPFCLRDIHIGRDMMLTYRFHIRHLDQWNLIERQVRQRIQTLMVNRG